MSKESAFKSIDLKKRLIWLVNLRWGGILGVLIISYVARETSFMSFSIIPAYLILGAAALCNLYYQWRLNLSGENIERLALVQIIVDQFLLASSVYFSGGCESPFIYFFIFHVVISGIILPWRQALGFAGTAVLFPALVIELKHAGVLPHYWIFKQEFVFTDMTMVVPYGLSFIATIVLTSYFVTYLSRQLHNKNEEVMQLYSLSERIRSSIRFKDVIGIIERELLEFTGARSSVYIPLNKERRTLSLKVGDRELYIPLIDKNSFTDAALRGAAIILDRRSVTSEYDRKALDLVGAERCMVLPLKSAMPQPCHEYFQCRDSQCAAFENKEGKCWQFSGTHCKGSISGLYVDKIAACLACELFTPVGLYLLDVPKERVPRSGIDMEAPMRLLDAGSLAVSNALLHEKTVQLSKTDGLTGLKNYREFKEVFHAELLRSKRYQRASSLLMIDVDHFKRYNDAYGHPQGDALLKNLAELIQNNFKDTDIVARYGGEEFAVLLTEIESRDTAVAVAERLRVTVERHNFSSEEGQPGGSVTISIGVSCYPEDGPAVDDIIQAADEALYRAKNEGRNRVVASRLLEQRVSPSRLESEL
jgi:diguanylate cyclase (GGDEF)-like protein